MANKLFTEFPPVTTEQWDEVIIKDLKGADYDKKLVWKTHEGFAVRPYYRAENLKDIKFLGTMPGQFPFVRGTVNSNEWLTRQDYCLCEIGPAKAVTQADSRLDNVISAARKNLMFTPRLWAYISPIW